MPFLLLAIPAGLRAARVSKRRLMEVAEVLRKFAFLGLPVVGALAAPCVLRALPFGHAVLLGPLVSVLAMSAMVATLWQPSSALATLTFFLTVNVGARPLGAALGGWVGAQWGEAACLQLALAGFVVQAGFIAASAVRRLPELPAPATGT